MFVACSFFVRVCVSLCLCVFACCLLLAFVSCVVCCLVAHGCWLLSVACSSLDMLFICLFVC